MKVTDRLDSLIKAVSPERALKREAARLKLKYIESINNLGYGDSGASTQKKSMKGWTATSKSPQEDIDPHLHTLRQRSRDLCMSSPLAASALNTKKINIVGPGLQLKSRINAEVLGLSREQAQIKEKEFEREFKLFAMSRHCDALKLNNFYELQAVACGSWFMNGDAFALIKYGEPTPWHPYALRLHLIEADRVSTPGSGYSRLASWSTLHYNTQGVNKENGNTIYNGVEVDKTGAVVAYWVCNQYPSSYSLTGKKKEWTRVEAFGEKTGNPNIIHLMDAERCEQYRGVPFLAPVIEALKQITRYQEAELAGALVQALFTAFIEVEGDTGGNPFGQVIPAEERVDDDDSTSYELGSGAVNVLGPGEKVTFADPKRPASGFEGFVTSMSRMIGAALDIPYEVLMKSFTASYSASRAALLEAWKAIKTERSRFAHDFCQQTYELWFAEAVARGRISAPGFFNDPAIRAAWCKAEWTGPTQGQIDPVKEVTAAILRTRHGFSTHEQETIGLTGGDWDDNIQQLRLENELLRAANGVIEDGELADAGSSDSGAVNAVIKNTIERSLMDSE